MMERDALQVLDFWFGRPATEGATPRARSGSGRATTSTRRFAIASACRSRCALAGDLQAWAPSRRARWRRSSCSISSRATCFATVRRPFAGDARALAAARALVAQGTDRKLPGVQRQFVYLPFEHAEDISAQDESLRLFAQLERDAPEVGELLLWAQRHHDIVARFGRFPHRNAALGRTSTPEELAFLGQPFSSF